MPIIEPRMLGLLPDGVDKFTFFVADKTNAEHKIFDTDGELYTPDGQTVDQRLSDAEAELQSVGTSLADVATVYASKYKTANNNWGDAINAAIAAISAGAVVLPAGNLTYSSPIIIKSNITLKGQGIGATVLKPTACHGISCAANAYLRFAFVQDLTIMGDNAGDFTWYDPTRNGINWNSGNRETYQCRIENVRVENMGGKGVFVPNDFSNTFTGLSVSHCGGNGVEVYGIITDTFVNCYVDYVPNGKAAFRIYSKAHMISCNGMGGNGEYWGVFGRRSNLFVDTLDNVNTQYYIILDNCNIEDFTKTGLTFLYSGGFHLRGTSMLAPVAGTFDQFISMETLDKTSTIDALSSFATQGATRNYISQIKSNVSAATLISYKPQIADFSVDGVALVKIPVITTGYEYLNNALTIGHLNILGMTYYYLGGKKYTHGTAAPVSGTWAVGDTVYNTNTTIGAPIGWKCWTAGTPGQWRPFGQTGFRSIPTSSRPVTLTANDIGYMYLDTTLNPNGKLVVWNGANYVDATGTIV